MQSFGTAEPLGSLEARLGEGPRWDAEAGRLLWYVTAREGLFALEVPYSGPPARPFAGSPPTA